MLNLVLDANNVSDDGYGDLAGDYHLVVLMILDVG